MILLFSGHKGAGKDTVGKKVADRISGSNAHELFARALKDDTDRMLRIITVKGDGEAGQQELRRQFPMLDESNAAYAAKVLSTALQESAEASAWRHTPTIRHFLQWYGTDVVRNTDVGYWVNRAAESVRGHLDRGVKVVYLTDGRFADEVEMVNAMPSGVTIRLNVSPDEQKRRLAARDGFVPSESSLEHASETALDGCDHLFDLVVNTDNLSEDETVDLVVEYLIGK